MNAARTQFRKPAFIGTGTMIALVLAAAIGVQHYRSLRAPSAPPKITGVKNSNPVPLEETIAIKILSDREQLGLNPKQTAALEKLAAEWKTSAKPVREELERRSDEFNRFMNGIDRKNPPSEEALQKHTVPVSEATREYIQLRDDFDRRALEALTPGQRKKWNDSNNDKESKMRD